MSVKSHHKIRSLKFTREPNKKKHPQKMDIQTHLNKNINKLTNTNTIKKMKIKRILNINQIVKHTATI